MPFRVETGSSARRCVVTHYYLLRILRMNRGREAAEKAEKTEPLLSHDAILPAQISKTATTVTLVTMAVKCSEKTKRQNRQYHAIVSVQACSYCVR